MSSSPALSGKTAVVTGSAKRVGAEVARALHAEGANVVIHYRRSRAAAEAIEAELNAIRSGSATLAAADIRDIAELDGLVSAAIDVFGRLDILVNNASTFYPTPVGTVTESQWDDLVGTNLRAPFFLSQSAAPHLRAAAGLIINIVDIHAMRPLPEHPVYCAAKAGLVMLTRSLARELGPEVRVNGIAPGPVLWPESGLDPALQAEIVGKTALKRPGSPEDIARTALFFAIAAPYVTGQIIAVDGGRSIGW